MKHYDAAGKLPWKYLKDWCHVHLTSLHQSFTMQLAGSFQISRVCLHPGVLSERCFLSDQECIR